MPNSVNSEREPQKQSDAEPADPTSGFRGVLAQWGWPSVAVVVVVAGMILGYVLFS